MQTVPLVRQPIRQPIRVCVNVKPVNIPTPPPPPTGMQSMRQPLPKCLRPRSTDRINTSVGGYTAERSNSAAVGQRVNVVQNIAAAFCLGSAGDVGNTHAVNNLIKISKFQLTMCRVRTQARWQNNYCVRIGRYDGLSR